MAKIAADTPFELSLGLEGTHVLVTGGCGLIGKVVVHAFLSAGAKVTLADIHGAVPFDLQSFKDRLHFQPCDISKEKDIQNTFFAAERKFGTVEVCCALASQDLSILEQSEGGLSDMSFDVWKRVFDVNVHGTFLTCRRWLRGIRDAAADPEQKAKLKNVNLIIMGSESGRIGVRTQPAYAAGKAALQYGLLQSLANDTPKVYPTARVNAVAPGFVDTARFRDECQRYGAEWKWIECESTVGLGKAVPVEDVARCIVGLASERWSGSTHGQILNVDGAKTGILCWTQEAIAKRDAGSGA